jgi:hypothetical protein
MNAIVNKKRNDREYAESEAMFRAIIQFVGAASTDVTE